jgi:hypothetical protein
MARTWGQLRFELGKFAPGEDLQLTTEWLNGAYREVLDHKSWKGLEKEAVLETVAPYVTGTVALTPGSTAVTGTGTTWTTQMSGRSFRVDGDNAYYTFTWLTATTGTIDRPYEGDANSDPVPAGAYHIFQNIFLLPSDVKYIQAMLNARIGQPMKEKSRAELAGISAQRIAYNEPLIYSPSDDSIETSPPVLHSVELYPIPLYTAGYPYTYQKAAIQFDGTNTGAYPLPWVSEDALIAGAKARILAHQKDYNGSQGQAAIALGFRLQMVATETRRMGPSKIQMAARFTQHRVRRWTK